MREHDVALMSYCPLAQAGTLREGILNNPVLKEIAKKYNATVEQVMLAWNIRDGHTIAIPRSGRAEHTLLNEMCIRDRLPLVLLYCFLLHLAFLRKLLLYYFLPFGSAEYRELLFRRF